MKKASLKEKFLQFIHAEHLVNQGDCVLLAVSGGLDSMVMTDLFRASEIPFGIAHYNFRLRGADSDGDEEFVKGYALAHEIPFFVQTFDTKAFSQSQNISIEMAARQLRYPWFEEICENFGFKSVATAHHLNDSLETVILHLAKGTGLAGLTGIPVRNGIVIRPLLFASRAELEDYANAEKISFRKDKSNDLFDYERNRIRHEIIPVLRKLNPSLEHTYAHTRSHLIEAKKMVDHQVSRVLNKLADQRGNDLYFAIAALKQLPALSVYLHALLFPLGFNENQIQQIITAFGASGKVFFSAAFRVIIDRRFLIITNIIQIADGIQIITEDTRKFKTQENTFTVERSPFHSGIHFNTSGKISYFDADLITFPLVLRRWQKGDYLYPIGLKKRHSNKLGKKKVSDLLTDMKTDLLQKEKTFVLLSGEHLVWVPGIRQDGRFQVSKKTKNLLKIKMD